MHYNSLREYIDRIGEEGELIRVDEEVDWNLEIGAIMRKAVDEYARCPAILFQKIAGYSEEYKFFTGTFADYAKYAMALDLPKHTPVGKIIREYRNRCQNRLSPKRLRMAHAKKMCIQEMMLIFLNFLHLNGIQEMADASWERSIAVSLRILAETG